MPNPTINKVKLPDNTIVDIHDSRITGVDSVVTQNSDHVVESGAVWDALQDKSTVIKIDLNGAEGIDGDTYTKLAAYAGYEGTQEGLDVFLWDDIEYQQESGGRLLRVTAAYSKYSTDGTHFSGETILVLYAKWKYEEEIFVYISTNVNYTTHLHDFIYTRKPLMPEPQKDVKVIVGRRIPEHPRAGSIYFFRDGEYKFTFDCIGMDERQMAEYIFNLIDSKIVPLKNSDIGTDVNVHLKILLGHAEQPGWPFGTAFYYEHPLYNWRTDQQSIVGLLTSEFEDKWDFRRSTCIVYFTVNGDWAKKWNKEDQSYFSFNPNAFRILRDGSWYPMRIQNAKTTTPNVEIYTENYQTRILCNRTASSIRGSVWNHDTPVFGGPRVVYYWRTKPYPGGKLVKRWVKWSDKYWEELTEYERQSELINKNGTTYLRWTTREGGSDGDKKKMRPCKAYLLVRNHYKSSVPIQ